MKALKIISVMGPHAGEHTKKIFERKKEDIVNAGLTFWCVGSYKSKPMEVQELSKSCQPDKGPKAYFIAPSSPGGAKDTKVTKKNTLYSCDNDHWGEIPEGISDVTGKGYALILDDLKITMGSEFKIDLNQHSEFSCHHPPKFKRGCSTICCREEDMSDHEDKVKSSIREVWAIGRLKDPFGVWIK